MNRIIRILTIMLVVVLASTGVVAQQKGRSRKQGNKARTEQTSKTGKKNKSRSTRQKPLNKAELQRQQKATQQEIAETKRKLQENERQVSLHLAELSRLQGDIEVSKGKVNESSRRVNLLQGEINKLQGQISSEQKEIDRLRTEYLKAVKAVRKRKNSNSDLAYIFSSSSFTDAARRMRYLREFSEWRDRQTSDIQSHIQDMNRKKQSLSQNKAMYDKALAVNVAAQKSLESQYGQKDAVVVQLRANGSALRSHLAKKQNEVNDLKGRVAALIAAEQAEAERKANERRIAEQRAAEQRAAEQRAAEKRAEEQRAAQEAERMRQQELGQAQQAKEDRKREDTKKKKDKEASNKDAHKDQPKKESPKRSDSKKEQPKKEQSVKNAPKREDNARKDNNNTSYADARNRRPRGNSDAKNVPAVTKPERNNSVATTSNGKSFASMRGSLPRPVSGAFRVTSPFGVHSLPDLPEAKYDNPGIDAEVAKGASAQAVFAGKVSGVYSVSGFSTVVIVNHGDYYTVYGNLASSSVRVGDNVKAGQTVGTVAEGEDSPGRGQIHFEVWKNREKQDPMSWIR